MIIFAPYQEKKKENRFEAQMSSREMDHWLSDSCLLPALIMGRAVSKDAPYTLNYPPPSFLPTSAWLVSDEVDKELAELLNYA